MNNWCVYFSGLNYLYIKNLKIERTSLPFSGFDIYGRKTNTLTTISIIVDSSYPFEKISNLFRSSSLEKIVIIHNDDFSRLNHYVITNIDFEINHFFNDDYLNDYYVKFEAEEVFDLGGGSSDFIQYKRDFLLGKLLNNED